MNGGTVAAEALRQASRTAVLALVLRGGGLALNFVMQAAVGARLGIEGYGRFSYVLAGLAILAVLAPLGWSQAIQGLVVTYTEEARAALLRGAILTGQQVALGVSLLCCVPLALMLRDSDFRDVAGGLAVLGPLYTWTRLQQQILLAGRRLAATLLMVEVFIPAAVILYLAGVSSPSLAGVLASYGGATLAAGLGQLAALGRSRIRPEFRRREWFSASLALLPGIVSQAVLMRADQLLVGPLAGWRAAGSFSLAKAMIGAISFANYTLLASLAPLVGGALAGGRRAQARLLLRWGMLRSTLWALPWCLLYTAAGGALMALVGAEFAAGGPVLQVLTLGALLNAAAGLNGQALLIGGHARFWALSSNVVTGLAVLGYLLVGPSQGALGVAWVTTASVASLNLWRVAYLAAALREPA